MVWLTVPVAGEDSDRGPGIPKARTWLAECPEESAQYAVIMPQESKSATFGEGAAYLTLCPCHFLLPGMSFAFVPPLVSEPDKAGLNNTSISGEPGLAGSVE